jgi:heat shock protein HslJ
LIDVVNVWIDEIFYTENAVTRVIAGKRGNIDIELDGGTMRPFAFMGLFGMLSLTSCDSVLSPGELSEAQGVWELVDLAGVSIPCPESYTVQFTSDGIVRAQADCNLCNGTYEAEGSNLTIGRLACTRAYCGPSSFFDTYTTALQNVTSFVRRGSELELTYAGGTMTFKVSGGT